MGFRVLGPVEVVAPLGRIAAGPPRQCAVLAALLVDCGHLVPVDVLVDRAWGAQAPDRAPRTLHTYIARLRRVVAQAEVGPVPARVVRRPGGYLLELDPDHVDLHRFHRLVEQAGRSESADERLAPLREAVGLWHGQPLAGLTGEWAERMRSSWRQQQVDAVVSWAQAELAAGDPAMVCRPVRELADEYPLVEPLVEVLMRGLAATGRTAEALQCYAAFRQRLADELGADPGPELQEAHRVLLRGRDNPPPVPVPAGPVPVPPAAAAPTRPGDRPAARRIAGRPIAILWLLTVAGVALHAVVPATHAYPPGPLVVGVLASLAFVAALTMLYPLRSSTRLAPVAGFGAAMLALSAVLAPLTLDHGAPTPVTVPSAARLWAAHTNRPAPLFDPSGRLMKTLPANFTVLVQCHYPGNPPQPWLADGVEYHVTVPAIGHVPEPYLTFAATNPQPPAVMPRCAPRPH